MHDQDQGLHGLSIIHIIHIPARKDDGIGTFCDATRNACYRLRMNTRRAHVFPVQKNSIGEVEQLKLTLRTYFPMCGLF